MGVTLHKLFYRSCGVNRSYYTSRPLFISRKIFNKPGIKILEDSEKDIHEKELVLGQTQIR